MINLIVDRGSNALVDLAQRPQSWLPGCLHLQVILLSESWIASAFWSRGTWTRRRCGEVLGVGSWGLGSWDNECWCNKCILELVGVFFVKPKLAGFRVEKLLLPKKV